MSKVKIYIAKNEELAPDINWQRRMGKELLTMGVRTWLGDGKFVPNVKTAEHGKPYLANSDLHFNISHSRRYVVCAIAEEEVGIDIQFHRKGDIDKIAKRIMSATEWQAYQEADDKTKYFFDLWAKKESYLKFTGEGITVDMRLLDIDACVQEIAIDAEYSCMLCTGSECEHEMSF
jgi:Phosphopantetheinyl transferase